MFIDTSSRADVAQKTSIKTARLIEVIAPPPQKNIFPFEKFLH